MLPWETSSPKPHFCLEIPKILKFILHSSKPGTHYDVFFNCWLPILLTLVFFLGFSHGPPEFILHSRNQAHIFMSFWSAGSEKPPPQSIGTPEFRKICDFRESEQVLGIQYATLLHMLPGPPSKNLRNQWFWDGFRWVLGLFREFCPFFHYVGLVGTFFAYFLQFFHWSCLGSACFSCSIFFVLFLGGSYSLHHHYYYHYFANVLHCCSFCCDCFSVFSFFLFYFFFLCSFFLFFPFFLWYHGFFMKIFVFHVFFWFLHLIFCMQKQNGL